MVVPCVQYRNEKATHTAEYKYYGIKIQLNHIHEPDLDTNPPKMGKTHMSLPCGITEKRHFTRNKKYVNMNILNIRAMYRKILFALLFAGFACLSLSAQKPLVKPPKPTQSSNAGSGKANSASQPSNSTSATPSKQPAKSRSSVLRIVATGSINGHDYVDLGLSVKWAMCNVGATSPSGYGNYYAWGETSTKSEYTQENSVAYKNCMDINRGIWYSTIDEQKEYEDKNMDDISGNLRYDAARENWGGSWRLPTKAEIGELVNKCKTRWVTYNGYKGQLVTGPNGKSIFFPAAGWRLGSSQSSVGEFGCYWSSTSKGTITMPDGVMSEDFTNAYSLTFDSGRFRLLYMNTQTGLSIRPVSE